MLNVTQVINCMEILKNLCLKESQPYKSVGTFKEKVAVDAISPDDLVEYVNLYKLSDDQE